jgi:hypothetical protein
MKLEEIFVSKLVSENEGGDSNRYEYIGLSRAIDKYGYYCEQVGKYQSMQERFTAPNEPIKRKTFDEWLLMEI